MAVTKSAKIIGKFTFKRGVHPPHRKKFSEDAGIRAVTLLAGSTVVVPMVQHIGAPNKPTVEKKQEVTAGQEIGSSEAFVSAPVHSPVNGVVQNVTAMNHPLGRKVLSVVISVGEQQPDQQQWKQFPADFDAQKYDSETIINATRQAGVVGQGGAAFPTAVKLKPNPEKPVDTILVNGCECEPYLTSDHRLMIEAPGPIVAGLQLAMRAAGATKGIIAIEDNKPDAINSILSCIKDTNQIQLAICKTKYPQGGEKQLINAVLKRVVPTGGLPLDVQVVVSNVGTLSSLAWAVVENRPVTQRIVTVTGAGVKSPGNFRVPVGMMLSDLLEQAGGLTDDAEKVLLGGPMMGPSTPTLDVPILKGTSGITVLTSGDIKRQQATACVRCGRCVDYCPLKLVPTRIAHAVKARDIEMALDYDLLACMECGCCSYVCPAQIPLLQYLRAGKQFARDIKK
ncbi:MAG: electron transport complex subunit RsxC [Sedimentisphaerales bacterium]|nr:electron transport complex subunit RsxC [Sedimentisphaerales bacterium]